MNPVIPTEYGRELLIQSHLRLLEICFYVSGGVKAIFSCFFIFHFIFLLVFSFMPESSLKQSKSSASPHSENRREEPEAHGDSSSSSGEKASEYAVFQWMMRGFALVIGFIILCGWTLGGLIIYAGYCIRKRKHHLFTQLMSGLQCLFIPYGTLIGVFALMTLTKPEASALFHPTPSTTPGNSTS